MPNPTELAWAAGFFDGEGHISAAIRKRKDGRTYCQLQLAVAQSLYPEDTDYPATLIRFANTLGGTIYKASPSSAHRLPMFTLRAYSHEAERIALLIHPYLSIVKQTQITNALELWTPNRTPQRPNKRRETLPEGEGFLSSIVALSAIMAAKRLRQ